MNGGDPYIGACTQSRRVMKKPTGALLWVKTMSTMGTLRIAGEEVGLRDSLAFPPSIAPLLGDGAQPMPRFSRSHWRPSPVRAGLLVPDTLRIHRKDGKDC